MNIRWDYFVNQYDAARYVSSADGRDNRHIQFLQKFASVVLILQDKTSGVIDLYKDMFRAVEDLATCPYTNEAFSELLAKIQAAVSPVMLCYLGRFADLRFRLIV
jgi:dynein heavy chain 1